jgi:hypothetical protein
MDHNVSQMPLLEAVMRVREPSDGWSAGTLHSRERVSRSGDAVQDGKSDYLLLTFGGLVWPCKKKYSGMYSIKPQVRRQIPITLNDLP